MVVLKGQVSFFETFSIGSVQTTDNSKIYACFINNRGQVENAFISLYKVRYRVYVFFVVIPKRESILIVAFSESYQFTNTMYIPQYKMLFSDFTILSRDRDASFSARVSIGRHYHYVKG